MISCVLFQFVCMGGSPNRLKCFATFIQNELKDHLKIDEEPCNLSNSDRYVLYKVGPVLAVNVSIYLCHYFTGKCELNN